MADDHFDYLVIGGGSGGIASARRAASYGAKVAVIEGKEMGGTCVNVGCVPKKIMFNTANLYETIVHDSRHFGITVPEAQFDWGTIVQAREDYISRLNGIYGRNLDNSGVATLRGFGSFKDSKTIQVGDKEYTADHILVAVGGHPSFPKLDGVEHCISSDGFFHLKEQPKKVAVIGAGYIAVELAGVFNSLGTDTTLIVRKEKAMGKLDSMLRDELDAAMVMGGINIMRNTSTKKVVLEKDGTRTLHFEDGSSAGGFEQILMAIGRAPEIEKLRLKDIGVETEAKGHIIVDDYQNTNVPGVYSLGDACDKRVELTPMAIAAGRKLSDRLFGGQPEAKADYKDVPTIIFSHPPIGTVGMTEEAAREEFGDDKVKVYTSKFTNLYYGPWKVDADKKPKTAMKIVCVGTEEKVVGLHSIGMGSDELLQGFGVALKASCNAKCSFMGATKKDLDNCVALHPTAAEELVTMPPWGQPTPNYQYKKQKQ
ncbi:glutathione reductase [Tribonema minus]|uniref:Glutathione reductase n=1 Tax=Tribonema minus TaxID=303371 RepID=A0A835Z402_9STRA|nr:glutathione reductase [Tribonema minus]